MKYSWIIISILFAGALIGAGFYFSEPAGEARVDNVSIIDGKQVIEIKAKGGYQPRVSFAKAGIPTIIRFDTEGTFDCSSSVRTADFCSRTKNTALRSDGAVYRLTKKKATARPRRAFSISENPSSAPI